MKKIVFLILMTVFLMGCETLKKRAETKIEVRTVTKNVFVEVPDEFMTKCIPTKPLDKVQYLSLTPTEKEYELVMYSNILLGEIAVCNAGKGKLKEWNTKQKEIFSKPQDSERKIE
jgi:hypothetical protein